jgi:hypothetical protein
MEAVHDSHVMRAMKKFPSPQATRMDGGRILGVLAKQPANEGSDLAIASRACGAADC